MTAKQPTEKQRRERRLTNVETLNTVFWLHMDACWMAGFARPAYVFAALTVLTGFISLRYVKKDVALIFVTLALNAWALMNSTWMVSELAKEPELLVAAKTLFVVGDLCLVGAFFFAKVRSEVVSLVLGRFRRLRFLAANGDKPADNDPSGPS